MLLLAALLGPLGVLAEDETLVIKTIFNAPSCVVGQPNCGLDKACNPATRNQYLSYAAHADDEGWTQGIVNNQTTKCNDLLAGERGKCKTDVENGYKQQFGDPLPTTCQVGPTTENCQDLIDADFAKCDSNIVTNKCIVPGSMSSEGGDLSFWFSQTNNAPFIISCFPDYCNNGVEDLWEEGVDCGATCELTFGAPYYSGVDQPCFDSSICENGQQDADVGETGEDCGGPNCPACGHCYSDTMRTLCSGDDLVSVSGAADIDCNTRTCTAADKGTCCVAKPTCADYGSCGASKSLIPNPSGTDCVGNPQSTDKTTCYTVSNSADEQACCVSFATCADFVSNGNSCTNPQYLKDSSELAGINCQSFPCTQDDASRCCDTKGTCADVSCDPAEYLDNPNPADPYCQTATPCGGPGTTDHNNCCIEKATCDTHTCVADEGWVDKTDTPMSQIRCAGAVCTSDDNSICCNPLPRCSSASICDPDQNQYLDPANPFCSNDACTGDESICCKERATCSSDFCGVGYTAINDVLCAGAACQESDRGACCTAHNTCVADYSSSDCPSATSYLTSDASLRCTQTNCSKANDESICCIQKSTCENFSYCSPPATQLKSSPESYICELKDCANSANDIATCCDTFEACSTGFTCTGNTINALNNPYCATDDCDTDSNAQTTCCDDKAACSTMSCGANYFQQTGFCVGRVSADGAPECYTGSDSEDFATCCAEVEKCSALWSGAGCPAGYANKDGASDVYCEGTSSPACTNTVGDADVASCCTYQEVCSDATCPSRYSKNDANASTPCEGLTCDPDNSAQDLAACCTPHQGCADIDCSTINQAPLLTPTPNYLCVAETCDANTSEDATACCGQKALCGTLECPDQWQYDSQSSLVSCATSPCDNTDIDGDVTTCCKSNQLCKTVTDACGNSDYAVDTDPNGKGNTPCAEPQCDVSTEGAGDFATCCSMKAKCSTSDQCYDHQIKNTANDDEFCQGVTCTIMDNSVCCLDKQQCTDAGECMDGWSKNDSNGSEYCESTSCDVSQAGNDLSLCCTEDSAQAPCSELSTCPHGTNDGVFCAGATCQAGVDEADCCAAAPTANPTATPTADPTADPSMAPTDSQTIAGDVNMVFGGDVNTADVDTPEFKGVVKDAIVNTMGVPAPSVTITDITVSTTARRRATGNTVNVGFEIETDGSTVTTTDVESGLGSSSQFVSNLNNGLDTVSAFDGVDISSAEPGNLEMNAPDPTPSPNPAPAPNPTNAPEEKGGGGGAGIAIGIAVPLILIGVGVAGWKLGWFAKCKKDDETTSDFTSTGVKSGVMQI